MSDEDLDGLHRKVDNLTDAVYSLSARFDTYVHTRLEGKSPYKDEDDFTQDFSCDENKARGNWTGRLDSVLSMLGSAVGLGNVWRFPYLCYRNGGAVFLIPYTIMLFVVGIPIFFLEVALGQYTSSGPLTTWEMAKLFKGIGIAMVIVSSYLAISYNMILAWSFYYLFASFTTDLPWQYCDKWWNTEYCAGALDLNMTSEAACTDIGLQANSTIGVCFNGTVPHAIYDTSLAEQYGIKSILPTEEYLNYAALRKEKDGSTSLENLGDIEWDLCLCLLLVWLMVCVCIINGIKSSGKVVYLTVLFPYILLTALLVRGVTLDGYYEGIRYYILEPDLSKLQDTQVWYDAAVQIFFTLSTAYGGVLTLASYNRFHNDILRDALVVCVLNCLTSFFAGFVIFSFLGFLATKLGLDIGTIAQGGIGLVFVVYPEAVLHMPVSPLWAILFFVMLIMLGLDSEFVLVETVVTSITDQWPRLRRKKSLVAVVISIIGFLLGLTFCTPGGSYMVALLDTYGAGTSILLIALLECICVTYVYGAFRFKKDISLMVGHNVCGCWVWNAFFYWWLLCWAFIAPLGIIFILILQWFNYNGLQDGDYVFPEWANILGWLMTGLVVLVIVLNPLVLICKGQGPFAKRLTSILKPSKYWGPALEKHRRLVNHLPNFVAEPWSVLNHAPFTGDDINMENGYQGRDNPELN